MSIYLPVSMGEALDKLSILEIKLLNITDHRKNNIETEHKILYDKLSSYIEKVNALYNMIKRINTEIWNIMNKLRDENIADSEYLIQCKKCIRYNDIRFRIKHKIDLQLNSQLKEQKGYKIDLTEISIDQKVNIQHIIKPIKFLSLIKDKIIIYTPINNIGSYFDDCDNIITNICDIKPNTIIIQNDDTQTIIKLLNIDTDEFKLLNH